MPTAIPDPTRAATAPIFGLSGRVVLSWTMAGAIAAGGFLSAGLALTRHQPALPLPTVVLLLLLGTALGLVHGSLLAIAGRPVEDSPGECLHYLAAGAIWAIPEFAAAGLIAFLIAVGPNALSLERPAALIAAITAVMVGGAICLWAAREGRRALRNAFQRWPERRSGVPVILGAFVLLAALFILWRPEIWWTDTRVNAPGALLLALGLTIWIAIPVTWLVLHYFRFRPATSAPAADDAGHRQEDSSCGPSA